MCAERLFGGSLYQEFPLGAILSSVNRSVTAVFGFFERGLSFMKTEHVGRVFGVERGSVAMTATIPACLEGDFFRLIQFPRSKRAGLIVTGMSPATAMAA